MGTFEPPPINNLYITYLYQQLSESYFPTDNPSHIYKINVYLVQSQTSIYGLLVWARAKLLESSRC